MRTTIFFKFLLAGILLCLTCLAGCDSCKEDEITELPAETQTGANTFGCYVNGELFVAQAGFTSELGAPYIYADYGTNSKLLQIVADGKKGRVGLLVLNPVENKMNKAFIVNCFFNGKIFEGYNFFTVYDASTKQNSLVEGKQNVGEVYITSLDLTKKIVSGTFHCRMGKHENDMGVRDINTYVLDSIANISQGRFDISMSISQEW